MIHKIITINPENCNGCGLCVNACHEGAIGLVNGKAVLLRDDYCDGLGNCLPVCPTGAIAFTERETAAYREITPDECCCKHQNESPMQSQKTELNQSCLINWPVQIKLTPVNASWFNGADLLIAADCCAYAYGNFHTDFISYKTTLIGCPKLDQEDYTVKLTEIIKNNNIKSVTVTRMEVPCCSGIEQAVMAAIKNSGKMLPRLVVTISTMGIIK